MSNSLNRTFIVGLIISIIGFCFYVRGFFWSLFVVVADFVRGNGISLNAFSDNGVFTVIGLVVMALGVFLVVRFAKTLAPK